MLLAYLARYGTENVETTILNHDGYMTVFDDEAYPRYMAYDADTDSIAPVAPAAPAPTGLRAFLARIRDFFNEFFRLLRRLFAVQ